MKLMPTGLGAEPKKLALLGAILAIGGVVYWLQNRSSGTDQTVSATATPPAVIARVQPPPQPAVASQADRSSEPPIPGMQRRRPGSALNNSTDEMQDFHPTLKVKDDMDLSKVDPRIKLDLLAKVRAVPMEGGSSSLFEFGKPPEPPPPPVAAINPGPVPLPKPTPPPAADTKSEPPKPPPAPPIPFKYYGYADKSSDGQLQEGFFIEGDDIFPVKEGDVLKNRYKVVRIGIRSATVEDTVTHDQKTLQLLEEQQ